MRAFLTKLLAGVMTLVLAVGMTAVVGCEPPQPEDPEPLWDEPIQPDPPEDDNDNDDDIEQPVDPQPF